MKSRAWMIPLGALVVAGVSASAAWAQDAAPASGTPDYTTAPAEGLDKNFSLPSFGVGTPAQRTMAPEKVPTPPPQFFEDPTEIAVPRQKLPPLQPGMQTPQYTTSSGSTLDDGASTFETTTPSMDDGSDFTARNTGGGSTTSGMTTDSMTTR